MTRTFVAMTGTALVLALAPYAAAQTADEIVEKHLAAMGGRAALSKLTGQVATGTVVVSAQGADIPGSVEISRKAPNKGRTLMKLDLSAFGAGEMIVDQRCDGKTAFSSNSMQGDREIAGDQLQSMLNASYPTPLLAYKEAGTTIELQGKDQIGGRAVIVLLYTPKTGPASRMFFDAETFLLARAMTKLNVPEAGGVIEQTSDVSDYRDVAGVKVAFSIRSTSPAQTVAITLSKVEINAPIDDAIFSRPGVK